MLHGDSYVGLRRMIRIRKAETCQACCNAKNGCFETPFLCTEGWFCAHRPVHGITDLSRFQTTGEVGLALGEDLSGHGNAVDCYRMIPKLHGTNNFFRSAPLGSIS